MSTKWPSLTGTTFKEVINVSTTNYSIGYASLPLEIIPFIDSRNESFPSLQGLEQR